MGVVYFIQPCGIDRVKIGFSSNAEIRYRGYVTECPAPIHVALELSGGRLLERHLHERFADHWYYGEWFTLSPEIAAFIEENGGTTAPGYAPDNDCSWCSRKYLPRNNSKFCSRRCSFLSSRGRRDGVDGPSTGVGWCNTCGAAFRRTRGSSYCSAACRNRKNNAVAAGADGPAVRVGWCQWCGSPFRSSRAKRFCSPNCSSNMWHAKQRGFDGPASPVSWCSWCSSQMRPERHGQDYCDTACRNAFNNHKNRAAA